jgi:sugar transferase (PEP-CTERM system associated)
MHFSQGETRGITNEGPRRSMKRERPSSTDSRSAIWGEEFFHEILALEKKRIERSGKPFILMLLDIARLCFNLKQYGNPASDLTFLSSITRETDIKGWYEHGRVLGVIFTEIGDTDVETASDRILEKVRASFNRFAGMGDIDMSGITFHIFPETCRPIDCKKPFCLKTLPPDACRAKHTGALPHFLRGLLQQRCMLFVGDIFLIFSAQLLGIWARFGLSPVLSETYYLGYSVAFLLYPAALYIFDLYNVHRKFHSRQTLTRIAMTGAVVLPTSVLFFYLIPELYVGRGLLALQMLFLLLLLAGWRLIYGLFFQKATTKTGTLIIGAGKSGKAVYRLLKDYFSPFEVMGFIDDNPAIQGKVMGSPLVVGTSEQMLTIAEQMGVKSAILAVTRRRTPRFTRAILEARLGGMEIIEMPALYERFTGRLPVELLEDQWLVSSEGFHHLSREYFQKLKRLIDFVAAGLLLLVSFPFMAVTALAIVLDSRGPIFYRQDRVGMGGKVFRVFKFRSMRVNAESEGAQWAQKQDDRITRVGKWIRKFRIDELPQILNVFMGEMSLVGPRPERPEFVKDLELTIPYYSARHAVQPGITGWAQVNFPYGASLEDSLRKLEYDLYYVKNMSPLLDLRILLKTVGVVLLGDGAR